MIVYQKTHEGMEPYQEVDLKATPKSILDIEDKILIYESHEKALHYLDSIFNDTNSRSLIIVGQMKSGKKTLLRLAEMRNQVKTIFINSRLYQDDQSCLNYILARVGIKMEKESFSETLEKLKANKTRINKRFVVVLTDIDRFFREKQKLLYNLFDMIKSDVNMALIGLTTSYDVTEKMEKRVRSRINADFYEIEDPYTSADGYIEFAQFLMGHVKLCSDVERDLRRNYQIGLTRMGDIKKYFFAKLALKSVDLEIRNLKEIVSKKDL